MNGYRGLIGVSEDKETIGKCSCIYEFDKHYIKDSLNENIKNAEKNLENIEKINKEKGETLIDPKYSRTLIRDLKLVRDRIDRIPICK